MAIFTSRTADTSARTARARFCESRSTAPIQSERCSTASGEADSPGAVEQRSLWMGAVDLDSQNLALAVLAEVSAVRDVKIAIGSGDHGGRKIQPLEHDFLLTTSADLDQPA